MCGQWLDVWAMAGEDGDVVMAGERWQWPERDGNGRREMVERDGDEDGKS